MSTGSPDVKLLKEVLQDATSNEIPEGTLECSDESVLAAIADGTADDRQLRQFQSHIESCDRCLDQVAFLVRTAELPAPGPVPSSLLERARRPSQGPPGRMRLWWLGIPAGIAAVLAILVGGVWFFDQTTSDRPGFQSERGTENSEFTVISPAPDEVLSTFPVPVRWESVDQAFLYEIRVASLDGVPVWEGRTESTEILIPATAEIESGGEYYVYVRAQLPGGKIIRSRLIRVRVMEDGQ